jgi:hypothetical protein
MYNSFLTDALHAQRLCLLLCVVFVTGNLGWKLKRRARSYIKCITFFSKECSSSLASE